MHYKDFEILNPHLIKSGWIIPKSTYECLSDYEKEFLELEFLGINSLHYYEKRLKELGFLSLSEVLDVGCGMGQWTVALANLNQHATGIDINSTRLLVAKSISEQMLIKNVRFLHRKAEETLLPENFFDAIFCYGTFMFTYMPRTLLEFHRILKPDGKLYLNVNSFGWYLHLLIDRGIKKRNISMIKNSLKFLFNTYIGKKQNIIISQKKITKMLKDTNFSILAIGPETSTTAEGIRSSLPAKYPTDYYTYPSIIEVLAKKQTKT